MIIIPIFCVLVSVAVGLYAWNDVKHYTHKAEAAEKEWARSSAERVVESSRNLMLGCFFTGALNAAIFFVML